MKKKTINDIDVANKRVLVRLDLNVPLENGVVSDDTRIRAALPTIEFLLKNNAIPILCSHLGRPKGKSDPKYSLKPVAERLGQLLDRPVQMAPDCVGPLVQDMILKIPRGSVVLLENLRFHAEEEANEPEFAKALASLAEIYVNDAFGSAHRAHASTVGVAAYLPAVAGFLMEKELMFLGQALAAPSRPFVSLLGGAKVSDKIEVIHNLLAKVDWLLIGGGMANTFLKAQGNAVGESLVENDKLDVAESLLREGREKLIMPVDVLVADRFDAHAQTRIVGVNEVPDGWRILDIGPRTVELFSHYLSTAQTVVWNGPMGVFEMEPFSAGTFAMAHVLAQLNHATTIVGGGDSASAVERAGVAAQISHISTGGGASLEFLEGKELPGVECLNAHNVGAITEGMQLCGLAESMPRKY
jgi:phosphoglycerate kinase